VQHLLTRALASLAMNPNTIENTATLIINFFNILVLPFLKELATEGTQLVRHRWTGYQNLQHELAA
jgi:hypothetical protein